MKIKVGKLSSSKMNKILNMSNGVYQGLFLARQVHIIDGTQQHTIRYISNCKNVLDFMIPSSAQEGCLYFKDSNNLDICEIYFSLSDNDFIVSEIIIFQKIFTFNGLTIKLKS